VRSISFINGYETNLRKKIGLWVLDVRYKILDIRVLSEPERKDKRIIRIKFDGEHLFEARY